MTTTELEPDIAKFATLILPLGADREKWAETRRGGLGCSDLSAVLGLNGYADRHSVWMEKVHGVTKPATWPMKMGIALEPFVREMFAAETGIEVREEGTLQSRHMEWLRYNPDGLTGDGGLFEAKVTNWWAGDAWDDDQVADHAELQVQGGMAVTGRPHAWVAALVGGDSNNLRIRRVERDDDLIETMLGAAERFWHDYVLTEIEPPLSAASLDWAKEKWAHPDPETVVNVDDQGLATIRALIAANAEVRAAEKRAKDLQAQVRDLVREHGTIMHGDRKLGTFKEIAQRRIDQKKIEASGLDPEAFKTDSTYTRFYWGKGI